MRFAVVITVLIHFVDGLNHLEIVHKWKTVEFEYPDHKTKEESISRREFVPGNALPLDVDVWYNEGRRKVFVTFPKFKDGIPATLGVVNERHSGDSALITPYPDWAWNTNRNCEGLTSVFRTQIDGCGRLWVIDSGSIDLSSKRRRVCQPQLVGFILKTNQLAGKHKFSDSVLREETLLTTLAIDMRNNNCIETFVYVADVSSFALLVYDAQHDKAWRIQSNSMYPYPPYGVFTANNVEFDLMDGILGMALSPIERNDRMLYYHSLASVRESWVPASVLRNERNFRNDENSVPRRFETSEEARSSQSAAQAFDKNGILYFGTMNDNALNCWNSENSYKASNIYQLEKDDVNLQFASGLKIIKNETGEEELWMITDRFQLIMVDRMSRNEFNFRILRAKVDDLLRNSACKKYKPIVFPNKTDYYYEKYTKPSSGYYG